MFSRNPSTRVCDLAINYMQPEKILALSKLARENDSGPFTPSSVDFSRPFIHEEFTQLSHTPGYQMLNPEQQRRYNQLSGMSSNELFMMFESGFTNRMIERLLKHKTLKKDPVLKQCLAIMLEEEKQHTEMFAAVNRQCMPDIYTRSLFYFTRSGLPDKIALWCLVHLPHHLLLVLWLVLIMEEFSNFISHRMIKQPDSDTLGPLDKTFIELHYRHLKDEARHVQIDANLIDRFAGEASMLKRNSNASVLRYLMRQIMTPGRAGVAVIRHLIREFPELAPQKTDLAQQLKQLKSDPGFVAAIRCSSEMRLTHLFMTSFPEFGFINDYGH